MFTIEWWPTEILSNKLFVPNEDKGAAFRFYIWLVENGFKATIYRGRFYVGSDDSKFEAIKREAI